MIGKLPQCNCRGGAEKYRQQGDSVIMQQISRGIRNRLADARSTRVFWANGRIGGIVHVPVQARSFQILAEIFTTRNPGLALGNIRFGSEADPVVLAELSARRRLANSGAKPCPRVKVRGTSARF